jgi:hypothetical protein
MKMAVVAKKQLVAVKIVVVAKNSCWWWKRVGSGENQLVMVEIGGWWLKTGAGGGKWPVVVGKWLVEAVVEVVYARRHWQCGMSTLLISCVVL